MSMSDCPKCWDTPCTCGDMYLEYTVERNLSVLEAVVKALTVQAVARGTIYGYVDGAIEEAPAFGN